MPKKTSNELYQEVTDKIVQALKDGIVPWRRPIAVEGGLHRSFSTKKAYRGVNQFTLPITAIVNDYKSPFWITMNQIKKKEGKLIKINKADEKGTGQRATTVVFFKMIPSKELDKNGDPEYFWPLLKHFNVFNLDQVEGIEAPVLDQSEYTPFERAESIVSNFDVKKVTGKENDYDHATDTLTRRGTKDGIIIPGNTEYRETFRGLAAATGHGDRLNRPSPDGHPIYNKETLTCEMAAALLSGLCDLSIQEKKATDTYLNGWINVLEDNPRLAVQAACKAQNAADYIVGGDEEEDDDTAS
jgi:antirestriction protein ArdC